MELGETSILDIRRIIAAWGKISPIGDIDSVVEGLEEATHSPDPNAYTASRL